MPTAQTHPIATLVSIGLLQFRLFVLVDHVLAAWAVFAHVFIWRRYLVNAGLEFGHLVCLVDVNSTSYSKQQDDQSKPKSLTFMLVGPRAITTSEAIGSRYVAEQVVVSHRYLLSPPVLLRSG